MKLKKLMSVLVIGIFLFGMVGCATNRTMTGAGVGAGAGGIASVIAGKSGTTAALLIMGGALLGGLIGNTMDQQAQAMSTQPENRGKSIVTWTELEDPTNAQTKCRKVTKKVWKDGNRISETTEEICTGNRTSNVYE
jgi:uncharacterized protein YcfJ